MAIISSRLKFYEAFKRYTLMEILLIMNGLACGYCRVRLRGEPFESSGIINPHPTNVKIPIFTKIIKNKVLSNFFE